MKLFPQHILRRNPRLHIRDRISYTKRNTEHQTRGYNETEDITMGTSGLQTNVGTDH